MIVKSKKLRELSWCVLVSMIGCALSMHAQTDTATVIHSPEVYLSGTLPVLYIDIEGGKEVTSKETYLDATYHLDAMGIEGIDNVGSADEPLPLQIKGRGNTSWGKPKKPYRIKLQDKASLLGMPSNRHFVLVAEWRDGAGRLNWEVGFFVSRLMGLAWTPEHHPVELVVNGDYRGLYFLIEKIRVGKQRVNIEEQDDEETDPDKITGGWLCEIDNFVSKDYQVVLHDRTTKKYIMTTVHSPEILSTEQSNYIKDLIKSTDKAIYCPDKMSIDWEKYIDLDMLARYYLVCEIVYQIEGFSGSCYWSKERGDGTKISFGPVWDFDTSMANWPIEKFFYEDQEGDDITNRNHWIMELVKYPRFQQRVRELWQEWIDSSAAQVRPHCSEWVDRVRAAHQQDVKRWYEYLKEYSNIDHRSKRYLDHFDRRQLWLAEQWAKPIPVIGDVDGNGFVDKDDVNVLCSQLASQPVDTLDWQGANTYDDQVLDICDLVGILRQIYRQNHPEAQLRYCQALAYGQNDKAVYKKLKLIPQLKQDSLLMYEATPRQVKLTFQGVPEFSAFEFDLTSPTLAVTDVALEGGLQHHQLVVNQVSDSVTHVIVYSDGLLNVGGADSDNDPSLTITFRYLAENADSDTNSADLLISNIHVAEDDMTPHYLADAHIPVKWLRNAILGDVNIDGIVDIEDLNMVVNIINRNIDSALYPYADLNKNGVVDIDDLNDLVNALIFGNPFVDYEVNGVKFRMVKLMGGTFTMGATEEQLDKADDREKPAHRVRLDGFSIGQTEVTQALWLAVMGENPSHFTGDLNLPVEMVSWDDCQLFIQRLNALTGGNFRLPTEAEWEYAARGGRQSHGYKYAGSNASAGVAWHSGNSGKTSHPVATKMSNELELFDMSGNVWEWCQDWYDHYDEDENVLLVNPTGPETGTKRVCRGGCWYHASVSCRVSNRTKLEPTSRSSCYGLRLAQ